MIQIITYLLAAVAAYRLWDNAWWLSVIVVLVALSYDTFAEEKSHFELFGTHSSQTANRFLWSTIIVAAIFIYSLLTN